MIDLKVLIENPAYVREMASRKGVVVDTEAILQLKREVNELSSKRDHLRGQINKESGAQLPKEKREFLRGLKLQLKELGQQVDEQEKELQRLVRLIPNLPFEEVPVGKDERENRILREEGKKKVFDFTPRDYLSLAEGKELDVIDIPRAAKVSGSRFGYLKREAVLFEFALVQFSFRELTNPAVIQRIIRDASLSVSGAPFVPVIPPVLVKPEMMWAMGYTERGSDEIFKLPDDNLYLVGTSEQSVGPIHQGEWFFEGELPIRYLAFSSCFRREAGSYGKDTKGILRVHQFDKVEMFSFALPETSRDEHRFLLAVEEYLMRKLNLPYRVVHICTGDLGDSAAEKFDIEAWLPGQNDGEGVYRETHSTSNTTDFQARRLNIRARRRNGLDFVHMLNGTAFAIGRMLIAIIENYQTKEGSIVVPDVLREYVGIEEIPSLKLKTHNSKLQPKTF